MKRPKSAGILVGMFFMGLSFLIIIGATRVPMGTFHRPGPGLFPLLVGIILGILSVFLFTASYSSELQSENKTNRKIQRLIPVFTIMAILGYALLLELIGYIILTFLLILSFGLLQEPKKKIFFIFLSFFTTILSYIIFSYFLGIPLPRGKYF